MEAFLNFLCQYDVIDVVIKLTLSAVLGGIIGFERGKHGAAAGLRTHILICIGSALISLTSIYLSESLGYTGDVARLSAQVISGVGFLGAGTILIRNKSIITGLTTAAGIWTTAAIGVAVGYGFFVGAVTATLLGVFVTALSVMERKYKSVLSVYIELNDISFTDEVVGEIKKLDEKFISINIVPAKSGHKENVGITCIIHENSDFAELRNKLHENKNVIMVIDSIGN